MFVSAPPKRPPMIIHTVISLRTLCVSSVDWFVRVLPPYKIRKEWVGIERRRLSPSLSESREVLVRIVWVYAGRLPFPVYVSGILTNIFYVSPWSSVLEMYSLLRLFAQVIGPCPTLPSSIEEMSPQTSLGWGGRL